MTDHLSLLSVEPRCYVFQGTAKKKRTTWENVKKLKGLWVTCPVNSASTFLVSSFLFMCVHVYLCLLLTSERRRGADDVLRNFAEHRANLFFLRVHFSMYVCISGGDYSF